MAGEIQADYLTGRTLYAQVRSATATIWNTAGGAFEAYNTANIADYDIALTEQGTASGYYAGSMPAVTGGVYNVIVKVRAGGAPAETDVTIAAGQIEWDGSAVEPLFGASVNTASVSNNAITAAAIADGAIDRATFAADTGLQTIRSNTAQAGGASSITLDASASAVDNFYKNCLVYLTGGTGAGQYRIISGYTGATKVATVTPAWATNPDNTSTFAVIPRGLSDAMAFNNDFDVMGFFTAMIGDGTFSADFAGSLFPSMSLSAGSITAAVIADNAIDAASIAADAGTEIGTAVWASATRTLTAGTNIQLPANGLDLVLVDGKTLPRAIAIIGGVVAGKVSGAGTGTEVFLGFNGSDVAATVTCDSNGNRTAVTY